MGTQEQANILSVWERAHPVDHAYGRSWYNAAHDFCVGLARRYHVPISTAAAVVAVLSPRVNWGLNQALAEDYLALGTVPTFDRTLSKLEAIVLGGADSGYIHDAKFYKAAVAGPKVSRFYQSILNPRRTTCVVIDRHALSIAKGKRLDDYGQKILERKGVYEAIENDYKVVAASLQVAPHVLQATTWLCWRREHGIMDAYSVVEDF